MGEGTIASPTSSRMRVYSRFSRAWIIRSGIVWRIVGERISYRCAQLKSLAMSNGVKSSPLDVRRVPGRRHLPPTRGTWRGHKLQPPCLISVSTISTGAPWYAAWCKGVYPLGTRFSHPCCPIVTIQRQSEFCSLADCTCQDGRS